MAKETINEFKDEYNERLANLEQGNAEKNKVKGLYPGILKSISNIDSLSEVQIYCIFEDLTNGKIGNNNDIEEINYSYYYIMYLTKKFGVKIDTVDDLYKEESFESFNNWLEYYRSYFNNLDEEERKDFEMRRKLVLDTSMYKPELTYKEYKSQVKLNITMNN